MSLLTGFENVVRQGEPLAMHTWFQLGGPAEYFAEPENADQLIALVRRCHAEGVDMRLLGQGSNILVRDEGVPGMVIRLSAAAFSEIRVEGRSLTAGGGALLGRAVTTAVHRGLAGLETLIGIPGTVGGALHGNAGTHSGNIGQWTIEATVIAANGEVYQRSADELVFDYRQSSLDDLVILEASCQLEEDNPRELAQRMQKQWIVKKASQPMGHQCAGCVFKNPRGSSAGELIDHAGLKGTRIGGAVVSDRHANFIVAEPECTAQDVLRLINSISRSTSWAVHSGSATMKFAWRSLTTAPPMRVPFRPAWSINSPRTGAARILEHAAGTLVPHRLRSLLDDPLFLHPLGQLAGIVLLQLATRLEDHQVVEAALAIVEHQLVGAALVDLAVGGNHRGLDGPLADVAAVGAGVAVQCAADGAGDADERFQPGQPAMDGRGDRPAQQGAAAGGKRASVDANLAEGRGGEPDHHAGHALVADQDVRSLAQQTHVEPLGMASPHQGDQLVRVFRLGEILGRPAQLEPGVHGQRLALPHHVLKTGQKTHDFLVETYDQNNVECRKSCRRNAKGECREGESAVL